MVCLKLFSLTLVFMVFLPGSFTIPINSDANKYQLYYLGTIEGKSYFTEQHVELTWFEAKAYCEAGGMRLGSITSQAQLSFLKNAYNNTTFSNLVWTGARDTRKPTQLSWDHNEEVLNASLHSTMRFYAIHTCADFHPEPGIFDLFATSCSFKLAVLCEIAIK